MLILERSVNLTREMTSFSTNLRLHIVYLAGMCIFSHQALRFVFSVARYVRKRSSWKSQLTSQKWEVFQGNSPMGWDVMQRPSNGISLAETALIDVESSVRGWLCVWPTKHRKKSLPVDNFTLMRSRVPPANRYELWPTCRSHRHTQF
jgi:hypothetical protein